MTETFRRPDIPLSRAIGLSVLSGVLTGFSQPVVIESIGNAPIDPSGLTGLLAFVSLVPHFVAVRDTSVKRTYWLSFVLLLVWFSIMLYWLVVAMNVFGHIPLVLSMAGLLLLTSVMSFGMAAPFAIAKLISRHFGFPFWVVVPFAFTGAEHIRNHGPVGGFPWGNIGNSLATVPLLLQSASLFGVYGLVLLITLVNAGVAEAVSKRKNARRARVPLALAVSIVALMSVYGFFRLNVEPDVERTVKIALLQGNIEQGIKNQEQQNRRLILERYHELQRTAVEADADVVVWPEASLPVGLREGITKLRGSALHAPTDVKLPRAVILGATVIGLVDDPESDRRKTVRYNSAIVADGHDLDVKGRFDKSHLVPFGEYVPWPFDIAVRGLVPGGTGRGAGFSVVDIVAGDAAIPVGATICFEGVFPEISRTFANDGAKLMFNVTNDAWYGQSSASYQHTLMYAVRAVETALPVARVANTGVSAFIDSRGRIRKPSPLYTTAVIVDDVAITDEWTPYLTIGDVVPFSSAVVVIGFWFAALMGPGVTRRRRRRTETVLGVLGFVVMATTLLFHFAISPPGVDEMASTRNQLIFIGAALVALGALSGRPWGRTAQRWVGGLAFVFCLLGVVTGVPAAILPSAAGAVVFVLAHRRKSEYTRDAVLAVNFQRE